MADLVVEQVVARELHHRFLLVVRLQLAFALHAQARRPVLGRLCHQPLRHGGLWRHRGLQQRERQARQRTHQRGDHFVGFGLAACVCHQQARCGVDPDPDRRLFGKGHRQQGQPGVVAKVLDFTLAGFTSGRRFDVVDLFLGLAFDHRRRNRLGLDLQLQDALAADRFDQGAVLFAARLDPADRLFLGGAAFDKARGLQCRFHVINRGRPVGADAVEGEVFEQGIPAGWRFGTGAVRRQRRVGRAS